MKVSRPRQIEPDGACGHRELRRTVDFEAFGILPEGQTFGLTVLDLSYDGCRVKSEVAVLPGTKLKISILGLGGVVEAVVRWSKDGHAGLEFDPEEATDANRTPRLYDRISLDSQLMLRRHGRQSYVARLFDLTPKGCRVEFIERPKRGETIWVKLDTFDSIEARVKWVDGFYGGLEFVRPIYPAVFDILLARLSP